MTHHLLGTHWCIIYKYASVHFVLWCNDENEIYIFGGPYKIYRVHRAQSEMNDSNTLRIKKQNWNKEFTKKYSVHRNIVYKEIKILPRHFLFKEAWLGCSEKKEFFPPYGKIGIPLTEHWTETNQAMEAPNIVCFYWENVAPVFDSFFALEIEKMVFYSSYLFIYLFTFVLVHSC